MNPISSFVERCDAVAERRCIRRSTLSTLIFKDGKRLAQLAAGNSDIGVLRLEEAKRELEKLAADAERPAA